MVSPSADGQMPVTAGETALARGAQQLTIAGRVSDPAAFRQALSDVNRLAEQVRLWPDAHVKVLKHPVDIRPEAAINAQTGAENEKTRIDFVLQIDLAAPAPEQGKAR